MPDRAVYVLVQSGSSWSWKLVAPSGNVLAKGNKEDSRANAIRAAKLAKMYSAQATVEPDLKL